MKSYRILVNNVLEDDIDAQTPLQAAAKYVESMMPEDGPVIHLEGGHLVEFDIAVLKTKHYTIEARRVPEAVLA